MAQLGATEVECPMEENELYEEEEVMKEDRLTSQGNTATEHGL